MENNPIFKNLLTWVKSQGHTIEQVENFTIQQAQQMWPNRYFTIEEFSSYKLKIIQTLKDDALKEELQSVASQVKPIIAATFPDVEFDRIKEKGKPIVRIWLEGRPEVEI